MLWESCAVLYVHVRLFGQRRFSEHAAKVNNSTEQTVKQLSTWRKHTAARFLKGTFIPISMHPYNKTNYQ